MSYETAMIVKNLFIFVIGALVGAVLALHLFAYLVVRIKFIYQKKLTEAAAVRFGNYVVTNLNTFTEAFYFITCNIWALIFHRKKLFYRNEARDSLFYTIFIVVAVILFTMAFMALSTIDHEF